MTGSDVGMAAVSRIGPCYPDSSHRCGTVTPQPATADTPLVRRRRLGSSGPLVTPIGLGLAALGRPGYINLGRDRDLGSERSVEALQERARVVLDAAWAAGIRYLDAARSYGLAERFLADWLTERGIASDQVVVGSKWGYTYTADWEVGAVVNELKDHSLATFQRQLIESRSTLEPWLRLYQVHSATLESGVLADTAVLGALAGAREGGLVIGLSVSGPRQAATIRQAMEVRVDGLPLFGAVQATWNLLEPSAGEALAEAHRAGTGVIVKEALANGRLLELDLGRRLTARVDATPDAIAIAAALAQPWADVVLSGAVTAEQVASNMAGLGVTVDAYALELFADLAEDPVTYWSTRSELAWT
jgi:aryl-alcohol dehydrogenase-like predicted oxidoreductase